MELAGPRSLGSAYLLDELIGSSETGEVWRGRARRSGTVVTVKLLRSALVQDPDFVSGLPRERAMLTGLRDANLAGVLDLVADGDALGIVMEHVPGSDLRALADRSGPLDPSLAVVLMAQASDGLSAIHARNVAHGALRPETILIDDSEGVPIVRLTDFAIDRLTEGTPAPSGASAYQAPELAEDGHPSPTSDLYAVGAVLNELLGGQPPSAGRGAAEPPVRPEGVGDGLWSILERLLAPDPGARPADAASVAAELRRLATLDLEARRLERPTSVAPVRPLVEPTSPVVVPSATSSVPPPVEPPEQQPVPTDVAGPETTLPRREPAVIAAKSRPRRLPGRRWFAVGAVVLVALVVAGAMVFGGEDEAPPLVLERAEVELAFDTVVAAEDVAVDRHWVLAGTDENASLRGRIEVRNASSEPIVDGRIDEVFPETMTDDLDTISFSPDPDLLDAQGLAHWDIDELAAGEAFVVDYELPVGPGPVTQGRLDAWVEDRAELQSAIAEERAEAAAVVVALTVDPRTMELPLGHDRGFIVTGVTAGGQPVSDAALARAEWTSSDPAVVTVAAGTPPIISATGVGTAVVRGQLDEASVELTVTVPVPDLSGLTTTTAPPSGSTPTTRVTQRPTTTARPPQTTTTRPPQSTTTTTTQPTTTTSTPRGTLPPPPP